MNDTEKIELELMVYPSTKFSEEELVVIVMNAIRAVDENVDIAMSPAKQGRFTEMPWRKALKYREDAITIFELTKGDTPEQIAGYSNAIKSMLEMAGAVLELTNNLYQFDKKD